MIIYVKIGGFMKSLSKYTHYYYLKRFFILLLLLFLFVFVSAISYVDAVSSSISNSIFRLHVVANSNSAEDQNLKYQVRDELIQYMNSISKNVSSKEDIIELANKNKETLYQIAKQVIYDNGYDYDISINIGVFDFPTKSYGDISFPAGIYDALRVEIGSAKGENWWCVMFPPLCFVDISSGIVPDDSKETIENSLSEEEYDIISNQSSPSIKFKFSLIEIFQNLRMANI